MKDKKKMRQQMYVGGSTEQEVQLDDRDMQLAEELDKERKMKIIIAVAAVLIATIVVVVYLAVKKSDNGEEKSRQIIMTYMESLETRDMEKVKSIMDMSAVESSSIKTLSDVFDTYESAGIQYTISYEIGDSREATAAELESVSSALYNKNSQQTGIEKGYVIPVTGTIMLTYNGQSSPYNLDMNLVCYEKDDQWYLGGMSE